LNAILGWTMGSVLLRSVHGILTTGASYFVVYTAYGPRERLEDCILAQPQICGCGLQNLNGREREKESWKE
jgi:hypothetical protein